MCVCVYVCVSRSVVSNSLQPMDLPGSSVHGILQARILEWVAIPFSYIERDIKENHDDGDFPGGPVVKTLCFQCRGCRFDPRSGN